MNNRIYFSLVTHLFFQLFALGWAFAATQPMGSYVLLGQASQNLQFQVRLQWPSRLDVTVQPPSFPKNHPLHQANLVQMGSWQDEDQMIQAYEFALNRIPTQGEIPGIEISYLQNGSLNGLHIDPMVLPGSSPELSVSPYWLLLILCVGVAGIFYSKRNKIAGKPGTSCIETGPFQIERMMLEALEARDFSRFFCLSSCPEFEGLQSVSQERLQSACEEYRYASQEPDARLIHSIQRELEQKIHSIKLRDEEDFLNKALKERV